ncbi:hypothetical protein RN001_015767 [Aquatica leii]|uniref:Protein tyrosine phosphatase domain-containing protein 1 n=1 Tax=Aquatica leii TaxID=1421715 RepID=A0AAN7NZF2_9COLE|nr:hypothetical protein RN001_015767 [Aquatica leii]
MNKSSNTSSPSGDNSLVLANYTKLSENIRRLTPQGIQCSVFCGGTNCKYENPENWTADSLAIQGIYSHWITDDILAMARPSTTVIIKKNVIDQFHSLGIKSIINLQSPKEHASCGEPLEDSGFSYDPNIFMENNIFYYNFAWKDYGDASLSELLNSIKVLAFAVTEGRVAIHCHAGLGRTGVLIACYLVYSLRVTANDAIKYIRLKRPGSVQTRGQILCVRHFAQFILPQNITYYIKDSKDKYMADFTLKKFLKRQRIVLHGYDERNFKHLPKIIHSICERMLELCDCSTEQFLSKSLSITHNFLCSKLKGLQKQDSPYLYRISSSSINNLQSTLDLNRIPLSDSSYSCNSLPISPSPSEYEISVNSSPKFSDSYSDLSTIDGETDNVQEELLLNETKCFQELQSQKQLQNVYPPKKICSTSDVITALLTQFDNTDLELAQAILQYEQDINTSQYGWARIKTETDVTLLSCLFFDWLECLKSPIFGQDNLEIIVIHYSNVKHCLSKFDMEEACLVEYLLNFISNLTLSSTGEIDNVLMRFIAALTQQTVVINSVTLPQGRDFRKLREGTLKCILQFFKSLLPLISHHHQRKTQTVDCDEDTKKLDG